MKMGADEDGMNGGTHEEGKGGKEIVEAEEPTPSSVMGGSWFLHCGWINSGVRFSSCLI